MHALYMQIEKGPLLPIVSPFNKAWNYSVRPFKLPPLTRLMLADVDAGSDTPSLVGKVLKWRKDYTPEGTQTSLLRASWLKNPCSSRPLDILGPMESVLGEQPHETDRTTVGGSPVL